MTPTGQDVFSSPAVGADGTVYVGNRNNNVYALNPIDGSIKWVFPGLGMADSSPAIGADGTIYTGAFSLYALNPDGTEKWHYQAFSWVNSSPAIGSDGTIYVGGSDGYVYAFAP
jgi:outer membrane protein assembly factor BamB